MPSLKPANNIIAAIVAGGVAGLGQHLVVNYGITISPDMQNSITLGVMAATAHAWDLATGQNIPPPTQGQMTPPPIDLPKT